MKNSWTLYLSFTFLLVLSSGSNGSCQELTLNDVRARFSYSVKVGDSCKALYAQLSRRNSNESIWKGYLGALTMSMANYTSNPFRKIDYFNSGKKLIEESVKAELSNVEIRFLRYSIQDHVPGWLGYNDNLAGDKKMILDNIANLEMPKLRQAIIQYILKSDSFTPEEKKIVSKLH